MQFNAVADANERAIRLWRSGGYQILATVPETFGRPPFGYFGLNIMRRTL